jgi:hypothetical protein
MTMSKDELREALAAYAHEAWSGWMRYMFGKCERAHGYDHEAVAIPKWAVERWTRQMNTSYADLPEEEKESDRKEADKILDIIFKTGLRTDPFEGERF